MIRVLIVLASALLPASTMQAAIQSKILVSLAPIGGAAESGRLIIFVQRLNANASPDEQVDFDPFTASPAWISAREVTMLKAGEAAAVDGETNAFPGRFSSLAPGTYEMQAVLDRNHDYAYGGRGPGDIVSKVVTMRLPGSIPTLTLDSQLTHADELAGLPPERRAVVASWLSKLKPIKFRSRMMTAFHRTPTFIRGWIALPPGYDGTASFPTVYSAIGFGNPPEAVRGSAARMMELMAAGQAPPMIWVYLDYVISTGVHEFADSANNGPWGTALTTELIPALEHEYRMEAKPSARFLTGHSSGGWFALWLQVRYPKIFGGSWPTAPDPSDFHDFYGADLYAVNPNFYYRSDGAVLPANRAEGSAFVAATMADYARSEAVLGEYGGQMASSDWVFSPRGSDGRPEPLFDRASGKINPVVAAYWRDNYDIANIIKRDWLKLKADLDGKIHLTVGTADTYYLDGPARGLERTMQSIGAKTDFRYLPGKTHQDLYVRDGDRSALLKDIAREIYAVARPGSKQP